MNKRVRFKPSFIKRDEAVEKLMEVARTTSSASDLTFNEKLSIAKAVNSTDSHYEIRRKCKSESEVVRSNVVELLHTIRGGLADERDRMERSSTLRIVIEAPTGIATTVGVPALIAAAAAAELMLLCGATGGLLIAHGALTGIGRRKQYHEYKRQIEELDRLITRIEAM